MPKRIIMAGYIRESDINLADSTTIESAAKAVREYGEKMGYSYPPHLEYKEAISGHDVPYYQRPRLMDMLHACERGEFNVLVITEVRALSRRGAGEVFVIYDTLQKSNVALETLNEKFSDDPMGELVLGFKAHYAKIERQLIHARMERGKADRIAIGHAPNGHPKPAYGYNFLDTTREVKGRYEFNHTIIYVDAEGNEQPKNN
ncbi:MAG: recombinase family protein [Ktedonobacteraceae bacterium]